MSCAGDHRFQTEHRSAQDASGSAWPLLSRQSQDLPWIAAVGCMPRQLYSVYGKLGHPLAKARVTNLRRNGGWHRLIRCWGFQKALYCICLWGNGCPRCNIICGFVRVSSYSFSFRGCFLPIAALGTKMFHLRAICINLLRFGLLGMELECFARMHFHRFCNILEGLGLGPVMRLNGE